jgi:hypothetical protein
VTIRSGSISDVVVIDSPFSIITMNGM